MVGQSILWRRVDQPGHDSARLWFKDPYWYLDGAAVFVEDGHSCKLDYQISCDIKWNTVSGKVNGWIGETAVEVAFEANVARHWRLNKKECNPVAGCIDVDLSFTPATNLLPIRRLQLAIGESAGARAAWLRFPNMTLAPLEQTYTRIGAETYRYEASAGRFVRDLTVNEVGFVTDYPGFWTIEKSSSN